MTMEAYQEAERVDQHITDLIRKYPVNKNALDWLLFCRTVLSTLEIIRKEALDQLQPKGSNGEEGGHR